VAQLNTIENVKQTNLGQTNQKNGEEKLETENNRSTVHEQECAWKTIGDMVHETQKLWMDIERNLESFSSVSEINIRMKVCESTGSFDNRIRKTE
jgi:hypothetical protein